MLCEARRRIAADFRACMVQVSSMGMLIQKVMEAARQIRAKTERSMLA